MNAVSWFEIPVKDLARATRFYNRILDVQLRLEGESDRPMAVFPVASDAAGGALLKSTEAVPSLQGTLVYLRTRGETDLNAVLARVPREGGRVMMEKTSIGPNGFIALIEDTEHNRVGLHAEPA